MIIWDDIIIYIITVYVQIKLKVNLQTEDSLFYLLTIQQKNGLKSKTPIVHMLYEYVWCYTQAVPTCSDLP